MSTNTLSKEELLEQVKNYTKQENFKRDLGLAGNPKVSFLAQGEYNLNFLLEDQFKKYVLRLNTGSQMHLANQIKYEYQALENLKSSTVTPKPLFLDDSCRDLPLGMLVMEYLPGRSLIYEEDLVKAAEVLAKVHKVEIPKDHDLIIEKKPLSGIWEECKQLIPTYLDSSLGKAEIKVFLEKMLKGLDQLRHQESSILELLALSIVNTEVNSGNFIIDDKYNNFYLVDWEKPLLSTPLQDLSHFMVPTTTLWKTDYRMTEEDRDCFIRAYCEERGFSETKRDEIKEALKIFDKFSAMRGISWSAMAWIEYQQPGRLLKNEDTFKKIEMYLQEDFLKDIFPEFI
ncbi:aminoglycoside phosphotransferase family protein [Orenia marismortui]|uniref:Ser/Thr protein kinase RdoA (MazF antagonist) n=1 Tax=Orenia marismortui TaxID=46469 RepID=A0A4V3GXJ8_9FIRM|nr:aminoglycoside phosphotransferase family protein [Orenia marismortui]TDX48359.1 Ser/Thr protein kinase RdoA (MazF antagonist) [Orenia marismortui]